MQYGGVIEFKICIKDETAVHTVAVNLLISKRWQLLFMKKLLQTVFSQSQGLGTLKTHSTNQWLSAIRAPLSCISCLELGHILPTLVCPSLMTYSNISDSWGSSFRFTRLGSLLSTLKVMPAFCRRNLKYKGSRNGKTEFSLIKKFIQHIKNLKHFSLQF